MFEYTDWQVHQEHYKDLLREAEKARLVKLALSAQRANKTMAQKNAQSKSEEVRDYSSAEVPCCNPTEINCCAA